MVGKDGEPSRKPQQTVGYVLFVRGSSGEQTKGT